MLFRSYFQVSTEGNSLIKGNIYLLSILVKENGKDIYILYVYIYIYIFIYLTCYPLVSKKKGKKQDVTHFLANTRTHVSPKAFSVHYSFIPGGVFGIRTQAGRW